MNERMAVPAAMRALIQRINRAPGAATRLPRRLAQPAIPAVRW
jgi:hypothetical protein